MGPMSVKSYIDSLCSEKNLNMKQLAEQVGINYKTLNTLVNEDGRLMNPKQLALFSKYTGKSKQEVFYDNLKDDDLSALSYLDSMMIVSKKINNKEYLSDGYMYKGNYYYLKGDYLKSLGSYLEARNYAENNSETYHILNFNIGLLKLELGNYQEAQNLFFDFKKYIEYKGQTKRIDYVSCLYAIAYTYNKTNMID